jgi:hypothetical protein
VAHGCGHSASAAAISSSVTGPCILASSSTNSVSRSCSSWRMRACDTYAETCPRPARALISAVSPAGTVALSFSVRSDSPTALIIPAVGLPTPLASGRLTPQDVPSTVTPIGQASYGRRGASRIRRRAALATPWVCAQRRGSGCASSVWASSRAHPTCREIKASYPHRSTVPRQIWKKLFASAQHQIGILVYVALFIAEDVEMVRLLASKARAGVTLRLLLADPNSPQMAKRGAEERIGAAVAAQSRVKIALWCEP